MSKVTGYEYKSSTGSGPALISHEQYSDGGNVFVAFLPENNEPKPFHSMQNAEQFLKENGFIIGENVTQTEEIPAKTLKSLNEGFTSISSNMKFGKGYNTASTKFSQALVKIKHLGVDEAKTAQRRAIFDLSYREDSPFKNEQTARSFLNSEHGARLISHYKNVVNHPEFASMVRKFGFTPPNINEWVEPHNISEATAPGMEDWVVANKDKFVDQYGKKKGLQILYATAWKLHDKKVNEGSSLDEAYVIDRIDHPKYGTVVWKNEIGYHTISSKDKNTGAEVIHALGKNDVIAKKWKTVKERLLKESAEWVVSGGFSQIAESIAAEFKE